MLGHARARLPTERDRGPEPPDAHPGGSAGVRRDRPADRGPAAPRPVDVRPSRRLPRRHRCPHLERASRCCAPLRRRWFHGVSPGGAAAVAARRDHGGAGRAERPVRQAAGAHRLHRPSDPADRAGLDHRRHPGDLRRADAAGVGGPRSTGRDGESVRLRLAPQPDRPRSVRFTSGTTAARVGEGRRGSGRWSPSTAHRVGHPGATARWRSSGRSGQGASKNPFDSSRSSSAAAPRPPSPSRGSSGASSWSS